MKPYQAILFDLDGTLLPMDLEVYTKAYLRLLSAQFAPGREAEFGKSVWEATYAMVFNDGSRTNEACFWEKFATLEGPQVLEQKEEYEQFYRTGFHAAKAFCGENPLARDMLALAHTRAEKVVLATNPLYPISAVQSRLSWVGLDQKDFDYLTTYDNSYLCKPAAGYYRRICEELDAAPEACLMIGNDLHEDAWGASQIGMPSYIVTDCLISHGENLADWRHMTFSELLEAL